MKMDARKQQVLLALITDFIATAEPVGSRTIARKYTLGVSPATIRNEMADLEEMGFIEQPHTSAGRVPSHKGYRYYVDFLMKKHDLSRQEEELISQGYKEKVRDVGHVIHLTGGLLSQITSYAAVVVTPKPIAGSLKHVQMILMNPGRAMVVVVMNTGAVHHRIIEVAEGITQTDLDTISQVFNAKLQGQNMDTIKLTLIKEIYFELSKHRNILDLAMFLINDSLTLEGEEKIYLGGVFNILNQPEFNNVDKVKTLLSLLEQEDLLCSLLERNTEPEGVTVLIGDEIKRDEMKECSIVTASYNFNGIPLGSIGVLGPTRMDYARVVSVVECMTRNLNEALEKLSRGWK
ncbi:eat-inducible transcription repressor HrcA [Desulfocucumis palustris]|uniref:Heat-inducible transcription repressor HrcA n=1 Tax=Desulfocucumis palustris TaxID=1898651 RepID=A0A2L2XAR6_9FIRM|nr:heat-inducible transcriptional repressor HrcA [Desulfocucumis palustris]GBF33162.1 eat-inducible transcription repressor HrcA [Desulfocucumis palustris]